MIKSYFTAFFSFIISLLISLTSTYSFGKKEPKNISLTVSVKPYLESERGKRALKQGMGETWRTKSKDVFEVQATIANSSDADFEFHTSYKRSDGFQLDTSKVKFLTGINFNTNPSTLKIEPGKNYLVIFYVSRSNPSDGDVQFVLSAAGQWKNTKITIHSKPIRLPK